MFTWSCWLLRCHLTRTIPGQKSFMSCYKAKRSRDESIDRSTPYLPWTNIAVVALYPKSIAFRKVEGGREGELPWALHVVEPSLLHPMLPRSRASGLVCRVSSASHERARPRTRTPHIHVLCYVRRYYHLMQHDGMEGRRQQTESASGWSVAQTDADVSRWLAGNAGIHQHIRWFLVP